MSTTTDSRNALISQLRTELDSRVVTPEHADYDNARTVKSGLVDSRPSAIVQPVDADEVARIVTATRDAGMELAVRNGGHSMAERDVGGASIVLDLARMRALDVDVERRVASARAGLTAGEYTVAAGEHGFATGFGDTGSVGISGITLGGGVGLLSRKYGLTIDDVLAADVVTADGQLLQVDAERHPDLFWAIRGGGGNFGVVTRLTYRLHELPTVVGGMLMFPASVDVVRAAVAEALFAPDELTAIINVMKAPPMPFVPAEYHGKVIVMALLCYAGPPDAGERAVAPFRALGTPIVDAVQPMPYPKMFQPEPEGFRPMVAGRTMFAEDVDTGEAELVMDRLGNSKAMAAMAQFRALGGAIVRVPNDATAFAHRDRGIMVNVGAIFTDAEELGMHNEWVSGFASALNSRDSAAYVNFLGVEGPDRVRAAYPGHTWDRLREIKSRYDPTNFFRLNQNIPPAGITDH